MQRDVYTLGLSLDYSEVALWWLLNFKARLSTGSQSRGAGIRVGRTFFYAPFPEELADPERARLDLLEAMGVEVIHLDTDRGFERAYHWALGDIARRRRNSARIRR